MKVRLAKRFARKLNGPQSEIVDLPPQGAEALIAEGWATAVDDAADETRAELHTATPEELAEAADRPRRRSS